MKCDVSKLIDVPYEYHGRNCLWASRAALELIFADFEGSELPTTRDEEEIALTRLRAGETRWHVVGQSAAAATKLGDLLQGRNRDGSAFVAVVTDQVGKLAITSTPEHNCHLRPLRNFPGVELVLRRGRPL